MNTLGRSCLISTSADSEETKREEQVAAEQALTKADFTMNGSLQQLSATLLDLRCWPSPQVGRRAHCLLRRSLSRLACSAHCSGHWTGTHSTAWASAVLSQALFLGGGHARSLLLHRCALVVVSGAHSGCGAWPSHCSGFSCYGAWAPGPPGFSGGRAWAQELWPPVCGAQAQWLCFMALVPLRHMGSYWTRD